MGWTAEQILELAPDAGSARSGRELASGGKWSGLGHDGRACWGECQGSGSTPYRTQVDLAEPAFKCSCPSRKFPCKHGLGLLLRLVQRPDAFPAAAARPAWVDEWLAARDKKAARPAATEKEKDGEAGAVADPAAQSRRVAGREARVLAGVDELRRWALDLVRQGLASAPSRPYRAWEATAARMVDAQAPGLARLVLEMAGVPSSGDGWPERLLERLGRLLLLLDGYSRPDRLPEPARADLRALVGWTVDQKELLGQAGLRDRWLVVGRRVEQEDRLRVQRLWLAGLDTGRPALLLSFAAPGQAPEPRPATGSAFDAELVFYPGAAPIRALIKERHAGTEGPGPEPAPDPGSIPAAPSVAEAYARFGAAAAANPWIDRSPMLVRGVIPVVRSGRWSARDEAGDSVPLILRGDRGWRLLAGSGGRPVGLFGEFDGEALRPLSFWGRNGLRALPEDDAG